MKRILRVGPHFLAALITRFDLSRSRHFLSLPSEQRFEYRDLQGTHDILTTPVRASRILHAVRLVQKIHQLCLYVSCLALAGDVA